MDTVLVDRKKFMLACDEMLGIGQMPWVYMGYKLYEAGFMISDVQSLQFAYVYPHPEFDDEKSWKQYQPIPVNWFAVHKFQQTYGVDITIGDD